MIKYHPNSTWLKEYVSGTLPVSISAAVAIHLDACPNCRSHIEQLTADIAATEFNIEIDDNTDNELSINFGSMCDDITLDDDITVPKVEQDKEITVKNTVYKVPQALTNMAINNFYGLGKLSRAKIELDEGQLHTHLMHIDADGKIPNHTHTGFELTLLLEGSFEDETDSYHAGDFIVLDKEHHHQPYTKEGCLCLTVVSDALHFTQGFGKLLNPIGKLIY